MTLDDLGSLGEFISGIAVVLSLLYVAYELRQNTRAVRADKNREMLQLQHSAYSWMKDEDFADVVMRAKNSPESLTPTERSQFGIWFEIHLGNWELAYYNHQAGVMDDSIWESWDRRMLLELEGVVTNNVWDNINLSYGDEFRSHVEYKRNQSN